MKDRHAGRCSPCRTRPEPFEERLCPARLARTSQERGKLSCGRRQWDQCVGLLTQCKRLAPSALLRAEHTKCGDGPSEVRIELQGPAQFGFRFVEPPGVSETVGEMVAV